LRTWFFAVTDGTQRLSRRKLFKKFNVEAGATGRAGVVAALALISLQSQHCGSTVPLFLVLAGCRFVEHRACANCGPSCALKNPRDPAPSDFCAAQPMPGTSSTASQPDEIEFGHINLRKKVFDLFGLPL
jgi:hypothetical protein